MQKTNLSKSLKELRRHKVILTGEQRKSIEGKEYTEVPYYINFEHPKEARIELKNFESIIKELIGKNDKESFSKLLNSNYMDKLFEKYKFLSVYNILKKHMHDEDYNKIISKYILNSSAFINMIGIYPEVIKERAKFFKSPRMAFYLNENQTARGHPALKDGVCFGPRALTPGFMES